MPSSLPVKDLIKRFFKDLNLSKGFAVRSKHPAKHGRTQRSSTVTHDEGDDSIPADPMHPDSLARCPGLEVSTNASSARPSGGVSLAHEALDMTQLALPFVQALTGVIPIVGGPMNAAIGGLLAILQTIDIHNQNKADLGGLTARLDRLSRYLCNAPPARNPLEEFRRDAFISMLQGTLDQLTKLYKRCAAYASIRQAIVRCSSEIDHYLLECSWSSQMQNQNDMHQMREEQQSMQEEQRRLVMMMQSLIIQSSAGSTSTRTVTLGCVTLVDATNRLHSIPMDVCDSFERFKSMLQLLFGHNTPQAQIQRRYMEKEQYELCIDDDQKITRLTSHEWPNIEVGTKIVMNVIIEKRTPRGVYYKCPFCSDVNHVNVGRVMDSLERQAGCSIDCRKCKQRFQISRGHSSAKRGTRSADNDSDFNPTTDAGMHFIRNLHVQQTFFFRLELRLLRKAVRHVVSSDAYSMLILQESLPFSNCVISTLAVLRQRPILKTGSLLMMVQRCPDQAMFRPCTMVMNTSPVASRRLRKTPTSLTTRIVRNSQAMRRQQKMGRNTRNARNARNTRTGRIMRR